MVAQAYQAVVERGGKVSQAIQTFRLYLGESDMLAYLLYDGTTPRGATPRAEVIGQEFSMHNSCS